MPPVKLKCQFCKQTFISTKLWIKHISKEIKAREHYTSLWCVNCGYKSERARDVGIHIKKRICRDVSVPKDQCNYCLRLFSSSAYLKFHIDTNLCRMNKEDYQWICNFISDEELFTPQQAVELDREFLDIHI